MSAPVVPPTSSDDPQPFQSNPPGGGQRQAPSQYSGRLWSGLSRWIQQNTFAPQWLPERLRRPLIGYVVAVLVELAAAILMVLLLSLFPTFIFSPVLTLIGVVLVALGWGTGPSLLATFLGTLLLAFLAIPPYFSFLIADPADAFGLAVYLVVGISIGLLAGRSQRARRQAEDTAQLLAQAEARSRIDADRLRSMLGALVATAEAMVQIRPKTPTPTYAGEVPPVSAADTVLPVVARRLAELTQHVLGCRRVSIAAVDGVTGLLRPVTEVGMSADQEQAWWASWSPAQRLEDRYGHEIATALSAGQSTLFDTTHLPQSSWYRLFGTQSGRILPMRLGDETVGTLVVDYPEPRHDGPAEEILVTETLARLGALVLEQDRLLRGWAAAQANELSLAETKAQMDAFLGIASHELKTPLTSLKLSLQGAERQLLKLTGGKNAAVASGGDSGLHRAVEQMGRTAHQMERLERLVNDLVDVSRIQAGKLELALELVDLATMLREVVDMQEQAAPQRTIRLQCPADVPALVYADAGRIEQVVTNYLTNALKYSPADTPVEVGLVVEPQQARVWVRDEGPGLPVEEQEHIWERFHRVKGIEVQSGTGVGLGLGLHISRMIVERHDGRVGVDSAVGEGSTFWFQLPRARTTPS